MFCAVCSHEPAGTLVCFLGMGAWLDVLVQVDGNFGKVLEAELDVVDPSEIELAAPGDDNKLEVLSELFEQRHVQASGHAAISRSVEG